MFQLLTQQHIRRSEAKVVLYLDTHVRTHWSLDWEGLIQNQYFNLRHCHCHWVCVMVLVWNVGVAEISKLVGWKFVSALLAPVYQHMCMLEWGSGMCHAAHKIAGSRNPWVHFKILLVMTEGWGSPLDDGCWVTTYNPPAEKLCVMPACSNMWWYFITATSPRTDLHRTAIYTCMSHKHIHVCYTSIYMYVTQAYINVCHTSK